MCHGQCPQKNDPYIGQAGGDHKAIYSFRIGYVAFINVKASAFLVGEECFYSKTFGIVIASVYWRFNVGDQIDRFFVTFSPPSNYCQGAISFTGKKNVSHMLIVTFRKKSSQNIDVKFLAIQIDFNIYPSLETPK